MVPRSRTGCLTCRTRKLKCSEERPVCAQCVKAKRECVPSSGITFRHQQNPSMNGKIEGDDGSLKSFYGYKETFGRESVWVDVPQHLTFVHTNNPYEDEDGEVFAANPQNQTQNGGRTGSQGQQRQQSGQWDYEGGGDAYASGNGGDAWGQNQQMYATHGLEALSAVASSQDQYSYAPPPAPMSMHTERPPSQHSHPSMSANTSPQQNNALPPSQGLDFILNPPAVPDATNNIDPQLSDQTPDQKPQPPQFQQQQQQQHPPQQQETPQSPGNVRTNPLQPVKQPYLPMQGHHRVDSTSRDPAIEDPELCFLLRDYSERAGLWMDLFDLGLFFSASVPLWAVSCPLLLYSAVALSAKSLSRVDGRKPIVYGQGSSPSTQSNMKHWPGYPMNSEEWLRKGREYYDIAVSLLRQSLSGASRPSTSSLPTDATSFTITMAQGAPLPAPDSDELVAATAILCVYEFLDASGAEWSRHLDGAKSLFEIAKDRMIPLTLPPSPVSLAQQVTRQLAGHIDHDTSNPGRSVSSARVAIFWNFARQDMLSAFINHTQTRLDTSDLKMWRGGGLKLTTEGFICPSNPKHPDYHPETAMSDDTISNALIWLTMKLVNFIAAGDEVTSSPSPLGLGVRQRELLTYWEGLDTQLQTWHAGLPDSFHAPARHRPSKETPFPASDEEWFPRSMCASTMQHFHFARIQLLHNKPELSTGHRSASSAPGTSLAARHATYTAILHQSRRHAKEIVAIGLGRTDEGARVHAVQPLWTAGLVLGNENAAGEGAVVSDETVYWRRTIVGLLRGIERDMGWASEYRVRGLLDLWGLEENWGL
ncbi:hypothetical protein MBLNU230_g2403t1 [Neophaeotheca triangularis]